MESSSKVSCFFEEKAFDKDGELVQSKEESINKIGHGGPSALSSKKLPIQLRI